MLDMSVIERANWKYCSPVVLVAKKDQTVRFCIDYRKLNRVTVFDPEPLPNPEDLFAQLSKIKNLSKIDMTKGYWQIPMAEASKDKTAFVTPEGQFRFVVFAFSEIALPLTDLTRKGQPTKVEWGEPQEKAYTTLKALLAKPPIIKLPDFSKQFVLRTDASDLGIAAILMQEHDNEMFPVAFASKKLLQRQRNYSTIEMECLSIIWAV